jgi:hypothetical protein
VRLLLHAGYCASFFRHEEAGAHHGNTIDDGRIVQGTADCWEVVYNDVQHVEPLIRSHFKQADCEQTTGLLVEGEPRQVRKLPTPFTGRTWCFDMSSAPAEDDGFVVVRRATRELKTEYDARVHAQVVAKDNEALAESQCKMATDAKWVVTHASTPTIQGSSVSLML